MLSLVYKAQIKKISSSPSCPCLFAFPANLVHSLMSCPSLSQYHLAILGELRLWNKLGSQAIHCLLPSCFGLKQKMHTGLAMFIHTQNKEQIVIIIAAGTVVCHAESEDPQHSQRKANGLVY